MFLLKDDNKKDKKVSTKTDKKSNCNIFKINCYNCHGESFCKNKSIDLDQILELPNINDSFIDENQESIIKLKKLDLEK